MVMARGIVVAAPLPDEDGVELLLDEGVYDLVLLLLEDELLLLELLLLLWLGVITWRSRLPSLLPLLLLLYCLVAVRVVVVAPVLGLVTTVL